MYFERLKATSRTLRFRLMLWNGGAVLLMGFVTLAAVRLGVRKTLLDEMDSNLREDLREASLAISELRFPVSHDLYEDIDRKARGHAPHGWYMLLLDSDGRKIWGKHQYADVNAVLARHAGLLADLDTRLSSCAVSRSGSNESQPAGLYRPSWIVARLR
jgi:hypothetical protein